jgi:uncharacterized protein
VVRADNPSGSQVGGVGGAVARAVVAQDSIWVEGREITVLDEDEFAEHQVRYGYPVEVVEQAQATTDDLVARLTARTEPFAAVGTAWLERFTVTS